MAHFCLRNTEFCSKSRWGRWAQLAVGEMFIRAIELRHVNTQPHLFNYYCEEANNEADDRTQKDSQPCSLLSSGITSMMLPGEGNWMALDIMAMLVSGG